MAETQGETGDCEMLRESETENELNIACMTAENVSEVRVNIWGDDEDECLTEQVILSVVWAGGKLGMSYYVSDTAHLYMMHDTAESVDYELLHRVLLEVCPTTVLTSSKQEDSLKRVLLAYAQPMTDGQEKEEAEEPSAGVEVLPSTEFKYEVCKRRLLSFPLPGVPADCSDEEKMIKLSSIITAESINMIRSLGALLRYLEKKRVGVELEDVSMRVPVLALRRFTLDKLMMMDENAFRSLQIFHTEDHPSVYKNRSGGKEGLSMFGIADHTRSFLGRKLLRLWFTRPLRDLTVLQQRLDAISLLTSPCHVDVTSSLSDCLKHIKNIPRILTRMNTSHASMADWQALYKTVYNSILISDISKTLPQNIAIFERISRAVTSDLHRIASLVSRIIDFDESAVQNRFVVKPGVDPELDEKKHTYNGLPELMTRVAKSELQNLDESVSECNVIYLPQLGYLLTFKCLDTMQSSGDFTMPNMEFMFLSEDTVHYKTAATKELDLILGDTQCEISDHETAIMHRLQAVVMEHSEQLLVVVECAAELDCLVSLALLAKEHDYTRPELTDDNAIYIKAGRHPLQELCVSPFVPNDTCCDLSHGRMKLLTGPNASGKSVYLKQVGLIVYLAHVGSFVPAEAAKIGLMEGIHTRIQTRESVSLAQSSFLIDLNQVSVAVHNATAPSLVLMDEFGKGTATVDGLSLLVATLHHWLAQGDSCPNVFVSTHFHSVIQQQLLPNTQLIEYLMMQSMRDGAELVFLYQLSKGCCDSSYACHIASTCGLSTSLIERATNVSDLIRRNEPLTAANKLGAETKNKRCAAMVSQFISMDLEHDDISTFLKEYILSSAKGVF